MNYKEKQIFVKVIIMIDEKKNGIKFNKIIATFEEIKK